MKTENKVELGDKVKDQVTGFVGITISKYSYLTGCDRFSVQPALTQQQKVEGKLPDAQVFDEHMLIVLKKSVVKKFDYIQEEVSVPEKSPRKPGGPKDHQDIPRR